MNAKRALAVVAALLAVLAAASGTSRRGGARVDVTRLANEIQHEDDHVTAIELAQWIKDRKPGLRVLDVRSDSEFASGITTASCWRTRALHQQHPYIVGHHLLHLPALLHRG